MRLIVIKIFNQLTALVLRFDQVYLQQAQLLDTVVQKFQCSLGDLPGPLEEDE